MRSYYPDQVRDAMFLGAVLLLSIILYLPGLGFYSDDWDFLWRFSKSTDNSLIELFGSAYLPDVRMRPVQILYFTILYSLFGVQPLGYHLVNAVMLVLGVVLFYLVFLELTQNRTLALAVSLIYGLLPHYSTHRFWFAAFQGNLSMTLYFLSLYCDLKILQVQLKSLWVWKILSVVSLLGSTLSYELFMLLFLLNPLLVSYQKYKLRGMPSGEQLPRLKWVVLIWSNLFVLVLVLVFKKLTTSRLADSGLVSKEWFIQLLGEIIVISYGDYGIGLPNIIWQIIQNYPNLTVFLVAVLLNLIILRYFNRITSQLTVPLPRRASMLKLVACGLIVFVLGYAIFVTNYNAIATSTGIGNRISIAAAVGVAISLGGILGLVSALLPSYSLRRQFFCVSVALLCTSGFLINNTIASFWIDAYRQNQEVLADIRQQFPSLPPESTLILDQVCPYVGPAVVFESFWDLRGALRRLYQEPSLQADIVTPNLEVKEDELHTTIYNSVRRYPYKNIFIYNFSRKTSHQITNAKDANFYFQTVNPDYSSNCPPGQAGYGVPIFKSMFALKNPLDAHSSGSIPW
ncbi:MAG TPA: hypothetical protein V6D14_18135 [Coleofasciculaceae cyanobacterium]|jgi:hypothetical protein